jgi:hypothetical protein
MQASVSHIQPLWLPIPVSARPGIAMIGLSASSVSSSSTNLLLLRQFCPLCGLAMSVISQITLGQTDTYF